MLKIIPDVDGKPKIAQLVGLNITEITVKGSWSGPAQLHLIPHVNAPVAAALPLRKVIGGRHFLADLTLPSGHVLVDYMKELNGGR
jgi:acetoacetate decarboxylase